MQTPIIEPEHPQRAAAQRWTPWAISVGAHLALAVGAFFVVWTITPGERERTPVTISFDDPSPAPAAPIEAPVPQPEVDRAPEPAPSIDLSALLPPPSAQPDDFDMPAPPPALAPPPPPSLAAAPRPEITFSGLGASNARDVVYVVDASGSMITTWPETKSELLRSIDALAPTQRFQVFLVSNQPDRAFLAAPIPPAAKRPVFIDATRRHKKLVADWLETIAPAGRSNPIEALEAAIAMKPDAAFLLSSRLTGPETADFEPQQLLDRLDRLNPASERTRVRPVTIKAIHLIESDPYGLMESIGRAHGGADGYRFISRDEFNSRRLRGSSPPERRP